MSNSEFLSNPDFKRRALYTVLAIAVLGIAGLAGWNALTTDSKIEAMKPLSTPTNTADFATVTAMQMNTLTVIETATPSMSVNESGKKSLAIEELISHNWNVSEVLPDGTIIIDIGGYKLQCGMINASKYGVYDLTLPKFKSAYEIEKVIGGNEENKTVVIWDKTMQVWPDGDPRFNTEGRRGKWYCPKVVSLPLDH